jgi:hypothetical protein
LIPILIIRTRVEIYDFNHSQREIDVVCQRQ